MKIPFLNLSKRSVGKPSINKPKTKALTTLASYISLGNKKLSNEKSVSTKLIESNKGWVYINSSVLAENVAKIELKLYQTNFVNGQIELVEIVQHELLDLLDKFNESTTSSDGFYLTETHLDLVGDSFWYTPLLNGKPTEIFILRPDKIDLTLGEITDSSRRLIESYVYKDNVDGKPVEIIYPPENIIPIKTPNAGNPYRGKSTVEAIAQDIDIDTYAGSTVKSFFENGMIVDFALSTEQRLNADQISNMQAQLRSAYSGISNAWNVPIFSGGVSPVELQKTNRDSQLIETMKWYRDKIMIAFQNTPASLGIIEDVNRANSESTLNNWKQSTIKPKMQRIVDALNEYLVPKYGDNLILGFENPVPEDDSNDRQEAVQLYSGGVITQNEAREILGYDAVDEGDNFKPSGSSLFQNLPEPVKNVNYKAVFRRSGVFKEYLDYKAKYDVALPQIKKMLTAKANAKLERPKYSFDYSKVDKYADIQLKIVDHHEQIFANAVNQLINNVVQDGIANVDNPEARKSGKLVNKQKWVNESINKLDPILTQVLIQAGNQANRLINVDDPYIPKAIKAVEAREFIKKEIKKFMTSAIETDIDIMVGIIENGLVEELAINQIRNNIVDKFIDYSKSQAERITRTEVIKTSNLGAQDAFEQSGIVEGKQWLATEDDRTDEECSELDGKIIDLDENYFEKGDKFMGINIDYEDVPYPPLHPNCRCVVLPVLVGEKGFKNSPILLKQNKEQKEMIKELEAKVDKRTKAYKEIKDQNLDDKAYIKALEGYLDE